MKNKKLLFIMLAVFLLAVLVYNEAFAQDKEPGKFVQFWRRLFRYPAKVTEESVDITTEAVKGETRAVTKTAETGADVITGDIKKTPDIVVTPVKKTAETVTEAAKGIAEMPLKAAEETAEPTK